MTTNPILSDKEAIHIAQEIKNKNQKLVTTNGVFDILHLGHIRYLQEAKKQGDVLLVAVNSDSSTKKNKGPSRPLNSAQDRAEALAALRCVDYVTIFNDTTPISLLEQLKPDVHVKGGDYALSEIVEKDAVEKNKGKVVLIPETKGYSTTTLIEKIKKTEF